MGLLRLYARILNPATLTTLLAAVVWVMLVSSCIKPGTESVSDVPYTEELQTDYQSVELINHSDKTESPLTIRNIVGVKVEAGDVFTYHSHKEHNHLIAMVVAVNEPIAGSELGSQAVQNIRLIKLIGSPQSFQVTMDAKSDQVSWLEGKVNPSCDCGDNNRTNKNGTYVVTETVIHLHSLDELH